MKYNLVQVAHRNPGTASGRHHVSKSNFSGITVRVPPKALQIKISTILSAYDDLIENNTKRIKILEEMAQTIYNEWFVKFKFTGHENVKMVYSELGMIPEGWEIQPVGNVIETVGGGTPSTKQPEYWDNGTITWFTPSDLTSKGTMFISESETKITKLGLNKSSAKIFPPYSVMMTSRATIGVVALNTGEACTNQGFITCIPTEKVSAYHLYYWVLSNKDKILSVASGATYKEINKSTFRGLPIVVPEQSISSKFVDMVQPLLKTIENLIVKNSNLRTTRDLLLPRLISGEVDVSELDINVEEITA